VSDLLQRLAEVSRQLIDAMSDVVWAINPERDSLRDLPQRMRRFAADTLNTQDIQVIFGWPAADVDARLDAHMRREIFLIFKEGINNLLRYANCTRADIGLRLERSALVLTIADDGIGVNRGPRERSGIAKLRERASALGRLQHLLPAGRGPSCV
jgi:signal transduction histidine kinase